MIFELVGTQLPITKKVSFVQEGADINIFVDAELIGWFCGADSTLIIQPANIARQGLTLDVIWG